MFFSAQFEDSHCLSTRTTLVGLLRFTVIFATKQIVLSSLTAYRNRRKEMAIDFIQNRISRPRLNGDIRNKEERTDLRNI